MGEGRSVFCHTMLLLMTRDRVNGGIDETEDVDAAISIARCISSYALNDISSSVDMIGVARFLEGFDTRLYVPSSIDILGNLNHRYELLDDEMRNSAENLLCIAHGSLDFYQMDKKVAVTAACKLAHVLVGKDSYKTPPNVTMHRTDNTEIEAFNTFCSCVSQSALFCHLSMDAKISMTQIEIPTMMQGENTSPISSAMASLSISSLSTSPLLSGEIKIGAGSFAVVTKVTIGAGTGNDESGEEVALKRQTRADIYLKEVALMCSMQHHNIQDVLSVDIPALSFCMTLQSHTLKKEIDDRTLTYERYRSYIADLFRGLAYIHAQGIMHGDLKPNNLLISFDGVLKISDFGQAMGRMLTRKTLPSKYITAIHRPYELLVCQQPTMEYGCEVDVWSAGIIILEMTHGGSFHARINELKCMRKFIAEICEDRLQKMTHGMDQDIALVIRQVLAVSTCRITAKQALAMLES